MKLSSLLMNKPLHFVLAGLLLYIVLQRTEPNAVVQEPVGLSVDARTQLRTSWVASMGREPTAEEMAALERRELDDELLFREALANGVEQRDAVVRQRLLLNMRFLGTAETSEEALLEQAFAMDMHRNDVVVRRRLVQVMEFALTEGADVAPVSEAELAAMYQQRREELVELARWRIVQVYFSADRRGERVAGDAEAALAAIARESLDADAAIERGDPFLGGHRLPSLGRPQLAAQFGTEFAAALDGCTALAWCGPLRSAFGVHLVFVEEYTAARTPGMEESAVRARLAADVRRQRAERQLVEALTGLRRKYGVQG